MENLNYTIDCWAFYGKVDWDIKSVYTYIASAKKIYALLGTKDTHYGFSETPYGVMKGAHIGSSRNVTKKVEQIYCKGARLKSLEFFSLPKNYNYQYGEYGIYFARAEDFIVIGYDTETFPSAPVDEIVSEIKKQLEPVWGEHFKITKGHEPFVYCTNRFEVNPLGNHLVHNTYIEKLQPVYIIEQFKV